MKNYPSKEVKEFGEKVMSALFDSDIQRALGGLGGCKPYSPSNFDPEVLPYVEEYAKGNLDSLAIAYAAMRTKELS